MDDWPDLRSLNVNRLMNGEEKVIEFEHGLRTTMFTFTTYLYRLFL